MSTHRIRNFGFLFQPLKQELPSIAMIALIVLSGYYKIFLGADFFLHENYLATSQYTYGAEAFQYLVTGRVSEFYDQHEMIPLQKRQPQVKK